MSVERKCRLCGVGEGIRFNFSNRQDEIEFHMENNGSCMNFKGCEIEKINNNNLI